MTSELRVSTIAAVGGTSALTLNSTGTITPTKMCYSQFGLTGLHDATSSNAVITTWTLLNSAPYTTLGEAITHSSGVFTFPHTGKFLISLQYGGYGNGGNRSYVGGSIQYSSDSGANFTIKTRALQNTHADGSYFTANCQVLFEITNISTQKVRFNDYVTGNTKVVNYGEQTMCIFQQVG
tara:strand:+ start:1070 stop:1609 length:540 start_codon:yes stop_codon:yes gene_type:complete